MARRKRVVDGPAGPLTDADYLRELHLLLQPFVGLALMSDDDDVQIAARDAAHASRRLDDLPPAERVQGFRSWLDERGWLERSERHLTSLDAARRVGGW